MHIRISERPVILRHVNGKRSLLSSRSPRCHLSVCLPVTQGELGDVLFGSGLNWIWVDIFLGQIKIEWRRALEAHFPGGVIGQNSLGFEKTKTSSLSIKICSIYC